MQLTIYSWAVNQSQAKRNKIMVASRTHRGLQDAHTPLLSIRIYRAELYMTLRSCNKREALWSRNNAIVTEYHAKLSSTNIVKQNEAFI